MLDNRFLRDLLGRYLGERIAHYVLKHASETPPHDAAKEELVFASVMFADIRDFTQLAESTEPHALFQEVNTYYRLIESVITKYGGTVNGFGGDSILALFGAPDPLSNHAGLALNAAVDIMDALVELNDKREAEARPPFRVGIGVNTGQMIMGNIGSLKRQTFTVLGDCVNSAKRLSDLSKDTPFYSIFGSECTIDSMEVPPPQDWIVEPPGEIEIRGRTQPLKTYAVTANIFA